LEIGTTKVRTLVGESREDGHIMVTGLGECPSRGVRKGEIVDFENALACVQSSLRLAEENSRVIINHVHLLVSGGHVQAMISRGNAPVMNARREITEEEIEHCMKTARAVSIPTDREVLHTICQYFYVDDQEGVINPDGMEGARLSMDMLILHGIRSRLRNTVKVARSAQMDVDDVAFSGLCSALAVLSPEQKEGGVAVIDLGGGTTDYVVYARGAIAMAGCFGVGGDHITNDIARGLRIPMAHAERMKEEMGSAMVTMASRSQRLAVPAEPGQAERLVKLSDLNTIIHLRMEEILAMVRVELEQHQLLGLLGAGIVLTGGGGYLKGVVDLAEKVFDMPCSLGQPRNVSGLAVATQGPEFAAPIGMLRYGFKTAQREQPRAGLLDFFRGLIGKGEG